MNKVIIAFLLTIGFLSLHAQTGIVKGRVIDNETLEGLPNANIFIDQTTIGVAADIDGNFIFKNLPSGTSLLVFSFVGYKSYQQNVTIEDGKTLELLIRLLPEKQELAEVEIKVQKDKKWESDLRKFQRYFLGDDRIGVKCKIENPWVLEFSEDKQTKDFLAVAAEPLSIRNEALGYKVVFFLKDFRYSGYSYRIAGNSQFTELPSNDPKEVVQQMKYRMESYQLSQRYFFKSILDNKLKENSFQLYVEKPQFSSQRSQSLTAEIGKSIAPWNPPSPEFVSKGIYRIRFPEKVEIHLTNLTSDKRIYKDVSYAVSWMEVKGGFVLVNDQGVPLNPGVITTSGEMNLSKVGHMLPLNFTPGEIIRAADVVKLVRYERLREKVYLSTDRSFYYPGEIIRVKGYLNYAIPGIRDSLSAILHIDLFNQEKKLLQSELLKIDSGFAFGGLKIPDSLRRQVLYVRAWTAWMRNYGTGSFFLKPIYLLDPSEVPAGSAFSGKSSEGLKVGLTEKNGKYLLVNFLDSARGTVSAHLNISINKIFTGAPVDDTRNILDDFPITRQEPVPHSTFNYPVEYFRKLSGQVFSMTKKPMEGSVTMVFGNMEDVRIINTGADGIFLADSLVFFDSVTVATQIKNRRGKVEGSIVWRKEDQPFQDFPTSKFSLKTVLNDRVVFDVTRGESRMLKEVTVTEKRPTKLEKMPYGDPDHILYSDQLTSTQTGMSLLNSLNGKIPGMQIITTFDETGARRKIVMRGGTTTIRGSLEPLVYINGVPVASADGTAASILEQINPLDVERIEVITRTNAMLGSLGATGLIAVFTKLGVTPMGSYGGGFTTTRFKGFQSGYERPFTLQGGTSAATVYWNPMLVTEPDSDGILIPLDGIPSGFYQVKVEGVTLYNEPVLKTFTFKLD